MHVCPLVLKSTSTPLALPPYTSRLIFHLTETIAASKVTIKRVERNKRKYVTAVIGLEAFGLELKKVAKDLGKKFATGASVTKLASGGDEIVVQGDVSEEIEEFLLEKWADVIPADNVELVEDKKKKSAASGPAV